ncbi:hypothetical protein [Yersinia similis]|nr:hypothetical protein [Yersinia similis]CNC09060.1 Uncharacterised protein [Yersinia similis]
MNNNIGYFQLLATIQQHPLVERVTHLTLQREDTIISPSETASVNAEDNEVLVLVWKDDDIAQRRGKNHE